MQHPNYPFQQSEDATQFFFESIGTKGVIQKVVLFTLMSNDPICNLALGDYDPLTGEVDDQSVSDNGDTAKILATIFSITHQFLSNNPNYLVYFQGNTPARNRLYRMAINQAAAELTSYFSLFGLHQDSWERFSPNRPYEAYLIEKR